MKEFRILLIATVVATFLLATGPVRADATIDNGINFLKSKQDSTGKVTGGFGATSQWAAIALSANEVDAGEFSNGEASLEGFLLGDVPDNGAQASDWENRILAIIAIGENPTNFGGVNYIEHLNGFYNENQLGETYLANDDYFGLLALIATGPAADSQIKQNVLDFIITHQGNDGGFSWSTDQSCDFCEPSADMTAAALQALYYVKSSGLTHDELDNAIDQAKTYLLNGQNGDGGFGYFGFSDADSTSWVLMAMNVTGMSDSSEAQQARDWLLTQQASDGGFLSWDGSNTVTTSHVLIALVGKGWIVRTFIPPSTIVPSELSTLVASGVFTLPAGATSSSTQSVTLSQQLVINIAAGSSGANSVTLPSGLVITRSDGVDLDVGALTAEETTSSSLSGLGSGVTAGGALQWGLPNVELSFSTPITINIYVGTALNGQILNVVRSTSGSGEWTSSGIVAPATCTVALGYCSFQATKASYFATTQNPSSQSTTSLSSPTPSPSATPSPAATPASSPRTFRATSVSASPSPTGEVLGESTVASPAPEKLVKTSRQRNILLLVLSIVSILGAGMYSWLSKKNR